MMPADRPRFLVAGPVNVDYAVEVPEPATHALWSAPRPFLEAPIRRRLGGGGAVAAMSAQQFGPTTVAAAIGGDDDGRFIEAELLRLGLEPRLQVFDGFRTGVAHLTYFADGVRLMVCDSPVTYQLEPFWDGLGFDVLFVSGYLLLRGRSRETVIQLLDSPGGRGAVTILDVVPHDLSKLDPKVLEQVAPRFSAVCIASLTAAQLIGDQAQQNEPEISESFARAVFERLRPARFLALTHRYSEWYARFDGRQLVQRTVAGGGDRRGRTDDYLFRDAVALLD